MPSSWVANRLSIEAPLAFPRNFLIAIFSLTNFQLIRILIRILVRIRTTRPELNMNYFDLLVHEL